MGASFEQANWSLTDTSEISHKHFEDLRKYIWVSYNKSRGLFDIDIWFGENLADVAAWEVEYPGDANPTIYYYLGELQVQYKGELFGNSVSMSDSQVHNNPPLDDDGELDESYWVRLANPNLYHHFDYNSGRYVMIYHADNAYQNEHCCFLPAYKWLPQQTDPQEQRYPIYPKSWVIGSEYKKGIYTRSLGTPWLSYLCIKDHTADSDNQPKVGDDWETYWLRVPTSPVPWKEDPLSYFIAGRYCINDGTEYLCILTHLIHDYTEPGVGLYWETYWTEEDCTDKIIRRYDLIEIKAEHITELPIAQFMRTWALASMLPGNPSEYTVGGQEPVDDKIENNQVRKNQLMCNAYQDCVTTAIDRCSGFLAKATAFFINNWETRTWQGGLRNPPLVHDPSTEADHPEYDTIGKAWWGCNASAYEYCLKKMGHYDWYWSTTPYVPKWLHNEHYCDQPIDDVALKYPMPCGCWRRTWKWSFGRVGTTMYPGNGDPPEYYPNKICITQAQEDAAEVAWDEEWPPSRWYDDYQVVSDSILPEEWQNGTLYEADGFSKNGKPFQVYLCTANHTSSVDTEPGVGEDWEDYWTESSEGLTATQEATLAEHHDGDEIHHELVNDMRQCFLYLDSMPGELVFSTSTVSGDMWWSWGVDVQGTAAAAYSEGKSQAMTPLEEDPENPGNGNPKESTRSFVGYSSGVERIDSFGVDGYRVGCEKEENGVTYNTAWMILTKDEELNVSSLRVRVQYSGYEKTQDPVPDSEHFEAGGSAGIDGGLTVSAEPYVNGGSPTYKYGYVSCGFSDSKIYAIPTGGWPAESTIDFETDEDGEYRFSKQGLDLELYPAGVSERLIIDYDFDVPVSCWDRDDTNVVQLT